MRFSARSSNSASRPFTPARSSHTAPPGTRAFSSHPYSTPLPDTPALSTAFVLDDSGLSDVYTVGHLIKGIFSWDHPYFTVDLLRSPSIKSSGKVFKISFGAEFSVFQEAWNKGVRPDIAISLHVNDPSAVTHSTSVPLSTSQCPPSTNQDVTLPSVGHTPQPSHLSKQIPSNHSLPSDNKSIHSLDSPQQGDNLPTNSQPKASGHSQKVSESSHVLQPGPSISASRSMESSLSLPCGMPIDPGSASNASSSPSPAASSLAPAIPVPVSAHPLSPSISAPPLRSLFYSFPSPPVSGS